MLNFIKSLIPNILLLLGYSLDVLAKGILATSTLVTHFGIQAHILFKTKTGAKFKELETAVKNAVQNMMNMAKQLEIQQQAVRKDDSAKLVSLIKGDKPQIKLATQEKKEEDESKN